MNRPRKGHRFLCFCLAISVVFTLSNAAFTSSSVYPNCVTNEDCEENEQKIFGDKRPNGIPPAECNANKKCLNPYRNGCLHTIDSVRKNEKLKRCFSKKLKDLMSNSIYKNNITFWALDWMTDTQQIYIAQVFIEEILFQPTNVLVDKEYSKGFYVEELPIMPLYELQTLSSLDAYPAIKRSNEKGNDFCQESCQTQTCKTLCAHVVMESWPSHLRFISNILEQTKDDTFVTTKPSGLHGKVHVYIPKWFMTENPALATVDGYQSRELLAKKFKRPVSWEEYCRKYHAKFPGRGTCPISIVEQLKIGISSFNDTYFYLNSKTNASFYTGYFTIDEENNCTLNKDTCAGNIISPNRCNWGSSYELFQFNDNVKPDKMKRMGLNPEYSPKGSYSTSEMMQIWDAAAANKEAVVMYWWYPDINMMRYQYTDFEMTPIQFKVYDDACRHSFNEIDYPYNSAVESRQKAAEASTTEKTTGRMRCWAEKKENREKFYANMSVKCAGEPEALYLSTSVALERM